MNKQETEILLSVGIPTFQRAELWPSLIINLELLLAKSPFPIEIVVSDNNSSDDSWEILTSWKGTTEFTSSIILQQQIENIGPARNLVETMKRSRGKFFVFIGDDDRFLVDEFISLISEINNIKDLQAAIFVSELTNNKQVTFDEAAQYIYNYGNAWMGVIRTCTLSISLKDDGLVNHALSTIWPQTMLGISRLESSEKSDVFLFQTPTGRRTKLKSWSELTSPDASYYLRSLTGLILAAEKIENKTSCEIALKSLVGNSSLVLKSHLFGAAHAPKNSKFSHECRDVGNLIKSLNMNGTWLGQFVLKGFSFRASRFVCVKIVLFVGVIRAKVSQFE